MSKRFEIVVDGEKYADGEESQFEAAWLSIPEPASGTMVAAVTWSDTDGTRPNVWTEVEAICGKLGLAPDQVRELVLTPTTARAWVFDVNDAGHKFVQETSSTEVAGRWRHFEVTTV